MQPWRYLLKLGLWWFAFWLKLKVIVQSKCAMFTGPNRGFLGRSRGPKCLPFYTLGEWGSKLVKIGPNSCWMAPHGLFGNPVIFTDCSEIMYLVIIEISLQVFPKPCTVDVFLGQPIKLIHVVSASEFHEYWWNDLHSIFFCSFGTHWDFELFSSSNY